MCGHLGRTRRSHKCEKRGRSKGSDKINIGHRANKTSIRQSESCAPGGSPANPLDYYCTGRQRPRAPKGKRGKRGTKKRKPEAGRNLRVLLKTPALLTMLERRGRSHQRDHRGRRKKKRKFSPFSFTPPRKGTRISRGSPIIKDHTGEGKCR